MTPAQVADVEGVLLTFALAVAIGALAASAIDARTRQAIGGLIAGTGTVLAAGVAAGAMAGSLWFSESAGFPPCVLCWYQRIAMYPLVVVLGIAGLRGSATGRITGIVLALCGLAVSVYHVFIETFPDLDGGGCDPANPCTLRWVEGLGFWTIPRMAAASFVLIVLLTVADHRALPISTPPEGTRS